MVHFIKSKGQYLKGEHFKRFFFLFFFHTLNSEIYKAQQVKTHLLTCFNNSLRNAINYVESDMSAKLFKHMYTKENKLHQSIKFIYI